MNKHTVTRLLIASSIALAVPLAAHADPMMDGWGGRMHRHGAHGMFGADDFPRFLRGLSLTDAQREKVKTIVQAQAPAMQEKAKEARNARMELWSLSMSGQYDEAKAKSLADGGTKAMAEIALMRARSGSQIYQVLTPEQQTQLKQRMESFKSRRVDGDKPPRS